MVIEGVAMLVAREVLLVEGKSKKVEKRVGIEGQSDHKKKGKKSEQEWLWIMT